MLRWTVSRPVRLDATFPYAACYCQTVAGFLIWETLSEERTDLSFTVLLVLTSAVILGSESRVPQDSQS
jgi:hypothetical protein